MVDPRRLQPGPVFAWTDAGGVGCGCNGGSHLHFNGDGGPWGGGPDCTSLFQDKPFCYTKPGACPDGKSSSQFEDVDWSFIACQARGSGGGADGPTLVENGCPTFRGITSGHGDNFVALPGTLGAIEQYVTGTAPGQLYRLSLLVAAIKPAIPRQAKEVPLRLRVFIDGAEIWRSATLSATFTRHKFVFTPPATGAVMLRLEASGATSNPPADVDELDLAALPWVLIDDLEMLATGEPSYCAACPPATFSNRTNQGSCYPCTTKAECSAVGLAVVKACTRSTNAVCGGRAATSLVTPSANTAEASQSASATPGANPSVTVAPPSSFEGRAVFTAELSGSRSGGAVAAAITACGQGGGNPAHVGAMPLGNFLSTRRGQTCNGTVAALPRVLRSASSFETCSAKFGYLYQRCSFGPGVVLVANVGQHCEGLNGNHFVAGDGSLYLRGSGFSVACIMPDESIPSATASHGYHGRSTAATISGPARTTHASATLPPGGLTEVLATSLGPDPNNATPSSRSASTKERGIKLATAGVAVLVVLMLAMGAFAGLACRKHTLKRRRARSYDPTPSTENPSFQPNDVPDSSVGSTSIGSVGIRSREPQGAAPATTSPGTLGEDDDIALLGDEPEMTKSRSSQFDL